MPVTGQTLPFISYGGTSFWFSSFALGIVLNISRKENQNNNKLETNEEETEDNDEELENNEQKTK